MKILAIVFGGLFLVIGLAILIIGGWLSGTYNDMTSKQQDTNGKWAEIQNQYQRRSDLIPNLVETVKGEANFEKSTLTDVIQARASASQIKIDASQGPKTAEDLQKFQAAQGQLGQALSRLMVVSERYPDLKSNEAFMALQSQLEGTENRITTSRERFNTSVQDYDKTIKSFPDNFLAGFFHFEERPYFQAKEGSEVVPTVKF